jgi:hypothetical protein
MAFEPKLDSDNGASGGQYFQIGRVKSVVLGPNTADGKKDPNYRAPSDVGSIKYELLYSPYSTSKSKEVSEPAYPIWYFIKQIPLVNEIVLIIVGPSIGLNDGATKQQYYYMPAYGIWKNPNHNGFPNMEEWADYLNTFANKPTYSGNSTPEKTLPLGFTFEENPNIKDLTPYEGDTIIQSRFGQSIRFGSTVLNSNNTWSKNFFSDLSKDSNLFSEKNISKNGDPITIIVNRQGERVVRNKFDSIVEDINKDGSSIYMTSTQEIHIPDLNSFPLKSFAFKPLKPIRNKRTMNINNPVSNATLKITPPSISNQAVSANNQDKKSIGE